MNDIFSRLIVDDDLEYDQYIYDGPYYYKLLKRLQKTNRIKQKSYANFLKCNVCKKLMTETEYEYLGCIWTSMTLHYIKDHNMLLPDYFIKILNLYYNSLSLFIKIKINVSLCCIRKNKIHPKNNYIDL